MVVLFKQNASSFGFGYHEGEHEVNEEVGNAAIKAGVATPVSKPEKVETGESKVVTEKAVGKGKVK